MSPEERAVLDRLAEMTADLEERTVRAREIHEQLAAAERRHGVLRVLRDVVAAR